MVEIEGYAVGQDPFDVPVLRGPNALLKDPPASQLHEPVTEYCITR